MSVTHYAFYSAMRRGLNTEVLYDANTGLRGTIDVRLDVQARIFGQQNTDETSLDKKVAIYGPGDVRGINTRVIVRTDPKSSPEIGDFEPNYFPMIEFAEPDFAWRFSPMKADNQTGELQPWIALIVLKDDEFEEKAPTEDNLPRRILVERSGESLPLPDIGQIWRWAHVQIIGDGDRDDQDNEEIVRHAPHRAVCRLLCPRKLEPSSRYTAFVVSTFKLGVYAGLGQKPPDGFDDATTTAWEQDEDSVELPYYYKWSFGTGLRGDFEYAVRLLKFKELEGIGTRPLSCSAPGFCLPGVNRTGDDSEDTSVVSMEGALRSSFPADEHDDEAWNTQVADDAFRKALADLLNRGKNVEGVPNDFVTEIRVAVQEWGRAARVSWETEQVTGCLFECGSDEIHVTGPGKYAVDLTDLQPGKSYEFTIFEEEGNNSYSGKFEMPLVPTVLPPIYGRWHAARAYVDAEFPEDALWLHELNLQPRYRVAAGLGSRVVRTQQEALMASAWDQLGAIEPANDIIRRAQFGREASGAIYEKLGELDLDDFFQITGPLHQRARLDYCRQVEHLGKTAFIHFRERTTVTNAVFDPAFQRIASPRGSFRKRQKSPGDQLVTKFFDGTIAAAGEHPVPDGTLSINFGDLRKELLPNLDQTAPNGDIIYGALENLARLQGPDETASGELTESPSLETIYDALFCALDPGSTICDRTMARVEQKDSSREGIDCLERIMAYPVFTQPMYKALIEISQDLMAPGLDQIPQNTVGALVTNRRFIESYMVGLNAEFASELLWREYPTDQRGSYFRQFWDPGDSLPPVELRDETGMKRWQELHKDIQPLHEWQSGLGEHRVTANGKRPVEEPLAQGATSSDIPETIDEKIVLVIRGDLPKKHPDTRIYAVKATVDDEGKLLPCLQEFFEGRDTDDKPPATDFEPMAPVFGGQVPPDITFLGFEFDVKTALGDSNGNHGIFFVFEERPMETRFGLDESAGEENPSSDMNDSPVPWSDLTWDHVTTDSNGYIKMIQFDDQVQNWLASSGADVARITLQKAFRMSIHANKLLAE